MKEVYIIKFSDSEDRILSKKELKELAVLWDGEVTKHGDILTEKYPEDHCDDSDYFPVYASWDEYKGDYSLVEPWVIPVPTHEEYITAVLSGECGEAAKKGLLNEQATWEMVEFIPAHREYREEWSHSRGSSDGYRSSGRSTVSRYQAEIPDTWVWVSSTGMRQELPTEVHRPQFKTKFSYDWYCDRIKSDYIEAYIERKAAWEATNVVKINKKVGKSTQIEKPADAKPAKHPLSKRNVGCPEIRRYFLSKFPEMEKYVEALFFSDEPHVYVQITRFGKKEDNDPPTKYLFEFKRNKETHVSLEEMLERVKRFYPKIEDQLKK